MAYDIWLSLKTKELLDNLKQNDPETYAQICDQLEKLSIQRENFKTGVPENLEVFILDNRKTREAKRIPQLLQVVG